MANKNWLGKIVDKFQSNETVQKVKSVVSKKICEVKDGYEENKREKVESYKEKIREFAIKKGVTNYLIIEKTGLNLTEECGNTFFKVVNINGEIIYILKKISSFDVGEQVYGLYNGNIEVGKIKNSTINIHGLLSHDMRNFTIFHRKIEFCSIKTYISKMAKLGNKIMGEKDATARKFKISSKEINEEISVLWDDNKTDYVIKTGKKKLMEVYKLPIKLKKK